MYASSLHKWHAFDQGIAFVKHHQKLAETLLILAFIGLVYSITAHIESLYVPELGRETEISRIIAGNVEPLTRLADPAYAQEYALRETYITSVLEKLLETSQVERAYAVVYEYGEPTVMRGIESRVAEAFEVTQPHIAPRFNNFQGMSRRNWLQVQQDERVLSMLSYNFFQSYGLELWNERGVAIGYIGFGRKRDDAPFQDWEVAQLREAAKAVERGLLQSLP